MAKHLTWIMLGWYLLLPPWVAPYRVNRNAPYSQWKNGAINKSGGACIFPSFEACANFKVAQMNALKNGQIKFTPISGVSASQLQDWNYRVYWNGRCVQR